ncbi:MAG: hypothetical protein M1820_006768 [Bogoriella megaspora]|nr:MAG: hypothetical protein M1820_006768 [Bogoriella megaspora]
MVLNKVPDVDVVLHCGDLTEVCSTKGLQDSLAFLLSINAELRLVIAGNHDTLLDHEYVHTHGEGIGSHEKAVKIINETPGVTYLREGTHEFTLMNGASFSIHASPFTPSQYGPGYSLHAFQYASGEDRYNPVIGSNGEAITPSYATNSSMPSSIIPPGIDIIMTHGPPKYILDRPKDDCSTGCEHLRRADDDALLLPGPEIDGIMRNSSRRRGYARVSEQAQKELIKGKQALMLNAAITGGEGRPGNAPWLVELSLPIVATNAEKKRKYSQVDGNEPGKRHADNTTFSKVHGRLEETAFEDNVHGGL